MDHPSRTSQGYLYQVVWSNDRSRKEVGDKWDAELGSASVPNVSHIEDDDGQGMINTRRKRGSCYDSIGHSKEVPDVIPR